MNKEIKFRAWLKDEKKMVKVEDIDFIEEQIKANGFWYSFDDIELIQYTGSKDKNGVEIYEGDFLLHTQVCGAEITKSLKSIKYKNGCFMLKNKEVRHPLYFFDSSQLEVVGNVIENKNLKEHPYYSKWR